METKIINITEIQSPFGKMLAAASQKGICWLEFNTDKTLKESFVFLKTKYKIMDGENTHLTLLKKQMDSYFKGVLKQFTVKIDLMGTDFQKRVWNELLTIPFGETRNYEQQTLNLGDIKAIRAVASANSKNPIAIVVPCHRVIGKNGSLTGYAGGIDKKKWLLNFEKHNSGKSFQTSLEF